MGPVARKRTFAAALLMLLAAAGWFFSQPRVPAGQASLIALDDATVQSLRDTFNHDADSVRILILQSPT